MPEIAPELPPATIVEPIGPGLTCSNGLQSFSGLVHRSADDAAGMPSAAGEPAWGSAL